MNTINIYELDPVEEISGFCQELIEWKDFDPDYEPIPYMARDQETRIWLSYLFVSFDSIATTTVVFNEFPELPRTDKELKRLHEWFTEEASKLYVGKERRRLKYRFLQMLSSYLEFLDGKDQVERINEFITNDPKESYDQLDDALETVKYNGPLTRYDFMELLQRQCDVPILPTHIGTIRSGCLGPVKAMNMVLEMFGHKRIDNDNKLLERQACKFSGIIRKTNPHMDNALIETTLCKYQKLVGGRYYTGGEIDEMLGEAVMLSEKGYDLSLLMEARQEVFHPDTLTENEVDDTEFLISLKKYGGEDYAPVTPFNFRYRGIEAK